MIAPDFRVEFPDRRVVPLQTMSFVPVHAIAEPDREFNGLAPAVIVFHESAAGSYSANWSFPQGTTKTEPAQAV
jgi:hypothetical protein